MFATDRDLLMYEPRLFLDTVWVGQRQVSETGIVVSGVLVVSGATFMTDGGHYILDASFGRISDAEALSRALLDIPGVVQHGLFLDLCHEAYLAAPDGVIRLSDR